MITDNHDDNGAQTQPTFPRDTFIVHSFNYSVDPDSGQLNKTAPDELVSRMNSTLIMFGVGFAGAGIVCIFSAFFLGSILYAIAALIFIIGGVVLGIIGVQVGNEMAELYYKGVPILGKITSVSTRDLDPIPPNKDFDLGSASYHGTRYYTLTYDFTTPNGIDVTGEELISSVNIAGPQVPCEGKNVIVIYLKEGKFKIA